MRKFKIGLLALAVLIFAILAGMIAFGTAATPPYMESISAPFRTVDFSDLPPYQTIAARDGSALSYRVYPAQSATTTVIAIHGSSADSASLHPLAKALQREGITVYTPDIRGHGRSRPRGDVPAATNLDDDMAELVALVRAQQGQGRLVLLGFSSGGGFALHAAATPTGAAFARTVLISPMLGPRAPTVRTTGERWAAPYIPRIIALLILERIGIHAFEALPVLAFAVAPGNPANLTDHYSFRMMRAFGTRDYIADLRNAQSPLAVVVGSKDELFNASLFEPTIKAVRPDVPVAIVPDLNHIAMTTDARATPALLAAIRGE
jgi:alpha-beta hydrolase superfamily lysophospholipase